jgi:uncharacterized protein (TIGR03083 family)
VKRREALAAAREARIQLVSDLRALDEADWDAPSLCADWAVRDVIAHMIRLDAFYHRVDRSILQVVRFGGLNRFLFEDARRWAVGRAPRELIDAFEATRYETRIVQRYHVWATFPLTEIVIHGQDIRRPLGIQHGLPDNHLVTVADHLRRRIRRPWGSWTKVGGVRFVASDADWTSGRGPEARGPIEAIIMTLAGRLSALRDLAGEGVALLAERAAS